MSSRSSITVWDANYEKLVRFQQLHGHTNVPFNPEYRQLAKWTTRQRSRKTISASQIQRLEKIGFSWETQSDRENIAWNGLFDKLLNFKRLNGHTLVPQSYPEDPKLGTWVANQRKLQKKGKVRPDRKEKLDEISFVWTARKEGVRTKVTENPTKYDKQWDQMYRRLVSFKEKTGHCLVPYSYPADPSLAMWVVTQRRVYNNKTWYGSNAKIQNERKDQLDQLGFEWDNSERKRSIQRKQDHALSESSESKK